MIDEVMIDANEHLKGLSAEAKTAIQKISKTDQEAVLANDRIEQSNTILLSINKAFGASIDSIDKIGTIATNHSNTKTGLEAKVTELTNSLEELKKGGNVSEALKKEVSDLKDLLKSTQDASKAQKEQYETDLADKEKKHGEKIKSMAFDAALAGFTPNEAIPKVAIDSTIETVRASFQDLEEADYGDKKAYKLNGQFLLNPANGNQPFTAKEWVHEQLKDIASGKKVVGSGVSSKSFVDDKGNVLFDPSGAKNRGDAVNAYRKQLQDEGKGMAEIAKLSRQFVSSEAYKTLPT